MARPPGTSRAGWVSLQVGVLFLSSSALVSGIALLLAISLWRPQQQPAPLSRPEARLLAALSLLMLLGTALSAKAGPLAWLGLANWLPFFWFFLAIRPYLATAAARQRVAFWLCAATVPVVVVAWLQHVMGWKGQLDALGGLIRWPMNDPITGTSLFDNPNVTGAWLALVMPFAVQRGLQPHQRLGTRLLGWGLALSSVATLVLSASRNAMATLLLTWPASGSRRLRWGVLALAGIYGALVLASLHGNLPEPLTLVVPAGLSNKLQQLEEGARPLQAQRHQIYAAALQWLAQQPWWGVGEQGFGTLYRAKIQADLGSTATVAITHAHSTPLEFALSHGIPALALLAWVVIAPLLRATNGWRRGTLDPINRAWWLAALVLIWVNIWDVPFFDSRLNIAGWLVLAGLSETAPHNGSQASKPTGQRQ
jgi:O-antigen ligase